ncbi:HXXEE domain-containing protein [Ammoniphilus resinae]|uniref:Uncharacterized membrane protein (UPF0136 family) n=1 Tax=Ammoniphilus resinae TaxID=861532 RepID=A0ABS4GU48_9BACL|nr:HXXEE domain-containing protein [Ammoniphilus resinae]MBP1933577.1 uncharacterized membrane protein (UPF0136 family) [Ammoniphilus resinae]
MSIRKVILLGPLIFFIHDLEEVLWAQQWLDENRQLIEGTLLDGIVDKLGFPPLEFGIVVGIVTHLYCIISYFAAKNLKAGISMNLYISTILILFVNVFTHLGQSILLKMYTPGVVTAVLVVLPYSIYALKKLKVENLMTKTSRLVSPVAAVGMVFILFGLMFVVGSVI